MAGATCSVELNHTSEPEKHEQKNGQQLVAWGSRRTWRSTGPGLLRHAPGGAGAAGRGDPHSHEARAGGSCGCGGRRREERGDGGSQRPPQPRRRRRRPARWKARRQGRRARGRRAGAGAGGARAGAGADGAPVLPAFLGRRGRIGSWLELVGNLGPIFFSGQHGNGRNKGLICILGWSCS